MSKDLCPRCQRSKRSENSIYCKSCESAIHYLVWTGSTNLNYTESDVTEQESQVVADPLPEESVTVSDILTLLLEDDCTVLMKNRNGRLEVTVSQGDCHHCELISRSILTDDVLVWLLTKSQRALDKMK